jgi:hypothetical protein
MFYHVSAVFARRRATGNCPDFGVFSFRRAELQLGHSGGASLQASAPESSGVKTPDWTALFVGTEVLTSFETRHECGFQIRAVPATSGCAVLEIHHSGNLDARGSPDKSFSKRGKWRKSRYECPDTDALRRGRATRLRYRERIRTPSRAYFPASPCTIANDFATC